MSIVKLMIGTDETGGENLLKRNFKSLSWWSDNMETVAHYYENYAIEITVELDPNKEMEYVRCLDDLDEEPVIKLSDYTYGFMEVKYPIGAIWYSFNADYLKENVVDIKEIFPDLSEFNEE